MKELFLLLYSESAILFQSRNRLRLNKLVCSRSSICYSILAEEPPSVDAATIELFIQKYLIYISSTPRVQHTSISLLSASHKKRHSAFRARMSGAIVHRSVYVLQVEWHRCTRRKEVKVTITDLKIKRTRVIRNVVNRLLLKSVYKRFYDKWKISLNGNSCSFFVDRSFSVD